MPTTLSISQKNNLYFHAVATFYLISCMHVTLGEGFITNCFVCFVFLKCNHFFNYSSYFDRAKENIQTENQMEGESGRSKSIAFEFAVAWMNKFVLHTDAMPTNGVRNLPSCLTKLAVYHIYSEDMAKANRPIIARSTFLYSMWRTQFPDVVIPKVRNRYPFQT